MEKPLAPGDAIAGLPASAFEYLVEARRRGVRFLDVMRAGQVDPNVAEIQFVVDEPFIGDNLATGRIKASGGAMVHLRNIRSPIVDARRRRAATIAA